MPENNPAEQDNPFGPPVDGPAQDQPEAAESGPTSIVSDQGIMGRLFDGSAPGPSAQQVQADYGLSQGWAIGLRGAIRVASGDGVPPIFELIFGPGMELAKDDGLSIGSDEGMEDMPDDIPQGNPIQEAGPVQERE
jgi:hypothetical protein